MQTTYGLLLNAEKLNSQVYLNVMCSSDDIGLVTMIFWDTHY